LAAEIISQNPFCSEFIVFRDFLSWNSERVGLDLLSSYKAFIVSGCFLSFIGISNIDHTNGGSFDGKLFLITCGNSAMHSQTCRLAVSASQPSQYTVSPLEAW
jgi:hypothetical protein